MSVNLRVMRYVVAVEEEGGFQRAADRLHIAQPPLSRQIGALERELGVRLFKRRPTGTTEAGRIFVDYARRILSEIDAMVTTTREIGLGDLGTVRIGYVLSAGYDTLPLLIDAMAEHPAVRIDAHEGWTPDLERELRDGSLDLVLSRNLVPDASIDSLILRRESLLVVVLESHRLAGRGSIALHELRGDTFCYFPRRYAPANHDALTSRLRQAGEDFPIWEHPAPGLRHPPLLDDRSFTLLPASMRDSLPRTTVGMEITDDIPSLDLALAWRRDTDSAPVRRLLTMIRSLATARGWI